ncbi:MULTISPECIES: hypothetical protein [unclassified Curtobacterium]|uniref:hypothetical protein n=1 Tax=unclassified Curtobacterium TaxID=257496 RepID=UPI0015E8AD3E|nr:MULTISPECIES: hypothetical protein [unclassified Curtobacterium]
MGIRIDPSLEFVWRDLHTVQIGVDPPRAVVPVASVAEERFLTSLRRETSREALPALAAQARCSPAAAAGVLAAVAPVLVDRPVARRRCVELHGSGPVVDLLQGHLRSEGVTVAQPDPPAGEPHGPATPEADLALAVADHVLDPALRSAWLLRDLPQLTVVVGDGRVRVGPVVEPDRGPCLHCVELARVDEDDHWPTLATQLWGRRAAPLSPHRAAAVAAIACRLALDRLGTGTAAGPITTSVTDGEGEGEGVGDGDGDASADRDATTGHAAGVQVFVDRETLAVTSRTLLPHPRCACRALPGNDSADGLLRAPIPAAPT